MSKYKLKEKIKKEIKVLVFIAILVFPILVTGQELSYTSEEITISELIKGTLLKLESPSETLAIIIPGSGPTDRNGNQQMMQNNSLKMLAEGLTKSGIATFRYDKRLFQLLKKNRFKEEDISFDDFVADAVAVIRYAKDSLSYKNLYILGHSQGSLVGILAAQQEEVAGLISYAGAGKPIDQVIIDQLTAQMPDLGAPAQEAFTTLRQEGKVEKFSPALMSILRPSVQPFMYSWMQYDPAVEISKLDIPILLINGDKDLQVDISEAGLLEIAAKDSKMVLIKNMNHILKSISGDDLENSKSYNEGYRPIAPEVMAASLEFIKK